MRELILFIDFCKNFQGKFFLGLTSIRRYELYLLMEVTTIGDFLKTHIQLRPTVHSMDVMSSFQLQDPSACLKASFQALCTPFLAITSV